MLPLSFLNCPKILNLQNQKLLRFCGKLGVDGQGSELKKRPHQTEMGPYEKQ